MSVPHDWSRFPAKPVRNELQHTRNVRPRYFMLVKGDRLLLFCVCPGLHKLFTRLYKAEHSQNTVYHREKDNMKLEKDLIM